MVHKIYLAIIGSLLVTLTILYLTLRNSQGDAGRFAEELRVSAELQRELQSQLRLSESERSRLLKESREKKSIRTVVETRPDGTRIETTDRTEETSKVFEESTDKRVVVEEDRSERVVEKVEAVHRVEASRYSVGARVDAGFAVPDWRDVEVTGAVRLGDWPIFLEGGYHIGDSTVKLGARYEF